MDRISLGRRIHSARKEKGITGERLSEACHINATYLRQIEAGTKTPSLPVFVSLCRELQVSPSYLLADTLPAAADDSNTDLLTLWQKATPGQMQLITAMIKGALTLFPEEKE